MTNYKKLIILRSIRETRNAEVSGSSWKGNKLKKMKLIEFEKKLKKYINSCSNSSNETIYEY